MFRFRSHAPLALLLALPSCMTSPHADQIVTRDSVLRVDGYHLQPNRPVTVQAWNPSANRWDAIGTARSGASGYELTDATAYPWRTDLRIPAANWLVGFEGRGASARLRGVTTDDAGRSYNLTTVNQDWLACLEDNDFKVGAFAQKCTAKTSPETIIKTSDYCGVEEGFVSRVYTNVHSDAGGVMRLNAGVLLGASAQPPRITLVGVFSRPTEGVSGSRLLAGSCTTSLNPQPDGRKYYIMSCSMRNAGVIEDGCDFGRFVRDPTSSMSLEVRIDQGTCDRVRTYPVPIESFWSGQCTDGSTPTPTPDAGTPDSGSFPTASTICRSAPVPSDRLITNRLFDPTRCGYPTDPTDLNVLEISPFPAVGSTMEICAGQSVPASFSIVESRSNTTKCSPPTSSTSNVLLVRRNS